MAPCGGEKPYHEADIAFHRAVISPERQPSPRSDDPNRRPGAGRRAYAGRSTTVALRQESQEQQRVFAAITGGDPVEPESSGTRPFTTFASPRSGSWRPIRRTKSIELPVRRRRGRNAAGHIPLPGTHVSTASSSPPGTTATGTQRMGRRGLQPWRAEEYGRTASFGASPAARPACVGSWRAAAAADELRRPSVWMRSSSAAPRRPPWFGCPRI